MYKTISLLFKQTKNKQGANFVTKFKGVFLNNINPGAYYKVKANNLVSTTQRSFSSQGQVFEKLSEKSVTTGKLNMRTTLLSENMNTILTFIEENAGNMNEGDYSEAISLISMKLEADISEKMNVMILEKRPAFQLIKTFIGSNFGKLVHGNLTSQSILSLLCQMSKRGRRTFFFSKEQEEELIKTCQHNLELNHSKMTMNSVLGIMTLLGLNRGVVNPSQYLKGREEEITNLGFNNILRYLRRLNWKGMNTNLTSVLCRFMVRDLHLMISSEKQTSKAKLFASLAKLESDNPYVSLHLKLSNLLKDIRSTPENHDQYSILSLIEGLVYFDDASKTETLKELYEIVTMTIKHQPENIRGDFVIDFINCASQIKMDTSLSHDHIKILLDYSFKNFQTAFENYQRFPNVKKILPVFTLMRKHKFMEKEYAAQFFEIIYPKLLFLPAEADIKSIKFVIQKILGEEYMNRIDNEIPERLKDELQKPDLNAKSIMSMIYKASAFVISQKMEEVFDQGLSLIEAKMDSADSIYAIMSMIEYYVKNVQEFIPNKFRTKMVEIFLNKLDAEKLGDVKNSYRFMIILTELIIVREREDLKAKVQTITKKLSEDITLKRGILNNFVRLAENETYVSNASIYKNIQILRELIKSEEYVQSNDRICEKLITAAFNFLYNFDYDSNVTIEGIQNILNFSDYVYNTHPNLIISSMYGKLPKMVKLFNQNNLASHTVALASYEYLTNSNNPVLSQDNSLLLEKVARSEIHTEKVNSLVQRYIKLDSVEALIESARSIPQKAQIFKLCGILNKKNIFIPDDFMRNLKDYVLEKLVKNSMLDANIRLLTLVNFTVLKNEVLNYREENKEYSYITKGIVQDVTIKKLARTIEGLPRNLNNGLVNRLYMEFSMKYEKEPIIDKNLMMRILDKMTSVKWTFPNFYNKVISDYEKNFQALSPNDHAELINSFAKVELNKEDVVRASANNINLKSLGEWDKFTLFNSLVRLGFTNQEWKELLLEKLAQEIDFSTVLTRSSGKDKFIFMINLWKLGEWPAKNQQYLENAIQIYNKVGAPKNIKSFRSLSNIYEEVITLIRRAPFYSQFSPELASFINSIFEAKKEQDSKNYTFQILVEYLKAMGHSDYEIYPVDKLCEIYLPNNKTAIIFAKKNNISIINNAELNQTGQFVNELLKSQGYNTVVINEINEWRNTFNEKDNVDIVKFLESLNVPNLVSGEIDFSSVEAIKRPSSERRSARQPQVYAEEE